MRIVLALGGNALLERGQALTAENQLNNIKRAAASIAKIAKNNELVIVHGNGPQVGLLMEQNAAYNEISPETTPYPMDVLGAQTCGMVGYMLQKELLNVDRCLGVVSLLTQTVVNKHDEAFGNPTKFVGPVYTKERAEEIMTQSDLVFKADGEYYRRVVASPAPKDIIELYQIEALLKQKSIVIAGGGGGVPVAYDAEGINLTGVECVIDKDSTACLMSKLLDADMFIILTDGAVYEDFGKPSQRAIQEISSSELKTYDFPAGSMGPKVDAVCSFVDSTSRNAAIGSLFDLDEIVRGEAGTHISKDAQLSFYLK